MAVIDRFWRNVVPLTGLQYSLGYFLLPPFLPVEGIVWKGASEIVKQFNYSASKNFVLARRPIKPTGYLGYVLVIKYRVGDIVYRYKLWDDDRLVLNIELYSGQIIKKNFSLEIWSLANVFEVVQDTAIKLRTLITKQLTDYNYPLEFEDCIGIDAGDLSVSLDSDLPMDFSTTAWLDNDESESDLIGSPINTGLGDYVRDAGGDIVTDAWGNPIRKATGEATEELPPAPGGTSITDAADVPLTDSAGNPIYPVP